MTCAVPVITTATDVHGKPAIDVLAARLGLRVENPRAIRIINKAFLADEPVMLDDPMGWIRLSAQSAGVPFQTGQVAPGGNDSACVLVTDQTDFDPAENVLVLRPPSLVLGIGCNRNTPFSEMLAWIETVFTHFHLSTASIGCVASIDLKQDEAAIRQSADHFGVPCRWFSADQLNQARGVLHPSETVQRHVGAKSVCEAAALLAARTNELIVPKQSRGNVTLAVARASCLSSESDREM
jgi:cobalt-precorrin 5A hydrolase